MEERARIPPGLPRLNPTISYWQDPPDEIADLYSTKSLPERADYVIIGSGISGACIAYQLLRTRPGASVVMLEARQACSGATGRNGGHTKAASYRSFLDHEAQYGVDEAIKIARLEYANIRATHEFAKEHGIDCASNACDTVDIIYDATHLANGRKAVQRMQETMGLDDPAARYEIFNAEEARTHFLTPNALGAIKYAAGSISAYRFTIGVLKLCLALSSPLNLQTHCAAQRVVPSPSSSPGSPLWNVQTVKGNLTTANLILATNGYTPHLLPSLQSLIVPLRGQVSAQRPGSGLPQSGLPLTYSFIYNTGYEYMITRPSSTLDAGTIVIGGGVGTLPLSGASEYGNTDDTTLHPALSKYLTNITASYFSTNWGVDSALGRLKREWTGIMGASADGLPYVGAMPDMAGVWLSASFNGHGMVLCFKCAEALVGMLTGGEGGKSDEGWFPASFKITKERFGRKFEGRMDLRAPGEAEFGERGEGSSHAKL